MENINSGYELMKQIFTDLGILYKEGVPDEEVGFYAIKNGIEIKMSDNFLKGFNIESKKSSNN